MYSDSTSSRMFQKKSDHFKSELENDHVPFGWHNPTKWNRDLRLLHEVGQVDNKMKLLDSENCLM